MVIHSLAAHAIVMASCLLISDSLGRGLNNRMMEVAMYPGLTTTRLLSKLQRGRINIEPRHLVVVLAVGTNDIDPHSPNHLPVPGIIDNLKEASKIITHLAPWTQVVFSAILPRPCDKRKPINGHKRSSQPRIRMVNNQLETQLGQSAFIRTDKTFFTGHDNHVRLDCFRKDGLHLSPQGLHRLQCILTSAVSSRVRAINGIGRHDRTRYRRRRPCRQ